MSPEIIFEEIQSSGKKQLRDFLRATAWIFFVSLCFNLYMQGGEAGLFTVILSLLLVLSFAGSFLVYSKLVTQIRTDGIYVKFPPIQSRFIRYEWSDILDVYIRNYDALSEYGGWGIRQSVFGKGYILPGNTGLQIVFRDKTRVLLNTKMPAEMTEALMRLGKMRP